MACFFGFGSLVNTGTHRYVAVAPADVQGWKRIWVNNDCYEHAFLSVMPEPQSTIQGLLAQVPNNDWQELDAREVGYLRRELTPNDWYCAVLPDPTLVSDVQMYVLETGKPACPKKPILWSYLETVLYGYYQWFGEEGMAAFIATTGDWTDVLDDREDPIYPRYVPAEGDIQKTIERIINDLN
jgi:hypothetical protein